MVLTRALALIAVGLLGASHCTSARQLAPLGHVTVDSFTRRSPLTDEQISNLALPSVVEITVFGKDGSVTKTGSGFVVAPNRIITNLHVVQDAHMVNANFSNGKSVVVTGVVDCNFDEDLCLLTANTDGVPVLPLANSENVRVGEHVVAVGEPDGLTGTVTTGIVSSIREYKGVKIIQTSAPISHGSSGGPLLNEYGRVIGITSFFDEDGQNLNFAYASGHIIALIADAQKYSATITWAELEKSSSSPSSPSPTVPKGNTQADDTTPKFTDKPLAGLPGVYVTVDALSKDATAAGLSADDLKTQIVVRLQTKNVPVFDSASDNASAGDLDLTSLALDDGNGKLAGLVQITVSETVGLTRSPVVLASAETWDNLELITETSKSFSAYFEQILLSLVDQFAADYTSQNPSSK